MLDIHTHLFWDSYDADRDEVIQRARAAGVDKMICVGTSPEDNLQAIAVAEKYDDIYASVGLHPHFFNEIEKEISNFKSQAPNKSQITNSKIQNLVEELRSLAGNSKVVAIGECGLDYFSHDPEKTIAPEQKQLQREGFLAQIALAQELDLPLIIHTRPSVGSMPSAAGEDAYEDMFEILRDEFLKAESYKLKAVLHCYMGDTEITEKFLTLPNVYFSFTGNITYPVKKALAGTKPARNDSQTKRSNSGRDDPSEVVRMIPLGRLFVETDCPFLAPQGKRGERNEPAYVRMTALQAGALKGVEMAVLEPILDENFQRVFVRNKA